MPYWWRSKNRALASIANCEIANLLKVRAAEIDRKMEVTLLIPKGKWCCHRGREVQCRTYRTCSSIKGNSENTESYRIWSKSDCAELKTCRWPFLLKDWHRSDPQNPPKSAKSYYKWQMNYSVGLWGGGGQKKVCSTMEARSHRRTPFIRPSLST